MSTRRALLGVVLLALAGQVSGVAYEVTVAGRFGTGPDADALALAIALILAVTNEFMTWITTLFLPHYVDIWRRSSLAAAGRLLRRSAALVLLGGGGLAVLLFVGASPLVALLAPRLPAGEASQLLRFGAPLLVLLPLSVLFSGALQAHEQFLVPATRQLCWYGLTLAVLLWPGAHLGIAAVPVGMVGGLLLFCAALVWSLRGRVEIGTGGEPGDERLARLGRTLPLLLLASAANYLNVAFERALAARQPAGSLAALTYAFRLLNFPVNLFLLSATTVLLPTLARRAARDDREAFEALMVRSLRLTLVFSVPLASLAVALAGPAIQVVLERGAFGAESTRLTATALGFYAPGIIGIAGVHVLMRVYQALHAVDRLVWIGIAVITLNVVLMPALTALLGFPGLPIAFSVTSIVHFFWLLRGLRRRFPGLGLAEVVGSMRRVAGAGAAAGLIAAGVHAAGAGGPLPTLLEAGTAGLAAYVLVLWSLSGDDARLALAFLMPRGLLGALRRP